MAHLHAGPQKWCQSRICMNLHYGFTWGPGPQMDKETAKSSTGSKSRNLGGGPFWPWWACLTADLFWRFLVCVCVCESCVVSSKYGNMCTWWEWSHIRSGPDSCANQFQRDISVVAQGISYFQVPYFAKETKPSETCRNSKRCLGLAQPHSVSWHQRGSPASQGGKNTWSAQETGSRLKRCLHCLHVCNFVVVHIYFMPMTCFQALGDTSSNFLPKNKIN